MSPASPSAARAAVILTVTSLILTTAIVGPFVFTYPAIARSYLQGNASAIGIVTMAAGPLFIGSVLLEGVLLVAGSVFLARGLSRIGHPKWIGIAYVVSAALYATPIPGFIAELVGSVMLVVAGAALTLRIGKEAS